MSSFPHNVDLDKANLRDVICYLNKPKEEDDPGSILVSRVAAIFVLLVTSTAATMFPVLATNARRLGIQPVPDCSPFWLGRCHRHRLYPPA
ncbi:hypothetical protein V2G26_019464 [Clonostachys chloroleuca]